MFVRVDSAKDSHLLAGGRFFSLLPCAWGLRGWVDFRLLRSFHSLAMTKCNVASLRGFEKAEAIYKKHNR